MENKDAYDNIERLRYLLQLEQFNTCLDSDLRSRLLDQKPQNLTEAARLADQHVAIHSAGPPGQSSRDWKQRQHHQGGSPRKFQPQYSKLQASAPSSGSQPQSKPPSNYSQPKATGVFCKLFVSTLVHVVVEVNT